MRVLVTWGSKRGGTEGIARLVGEALGAAGHEAVLRPAARAHHESRFDAAIIGGALYANRWHPAARRFVWRRRAVLRRVPVWLFSSGPLDNSADHAELPPTTQVAALAELVGAQAHETFGGRLEANAKGFPASAMARKHSGDWRNPERIHAWVAQVAGKLPGSVPRPAADPPAASPLRLAAHALVGWAVCGLLMEILLAVASQRVALWVHGFVAPLVFVAVAWHYFRRPGAREARDTAFFFIFLTALLDLFVIAGLVQRSLAMFRSMFGTWLPLLLIFLATWATGAVMSMLPPKAPLRDRGRVVTGPSGA
jgi:menaquinone-dependent protoporphyrinogen oxidase